MSLHRGESLADELKRDGCGPTLAAAFASVIAAAPGSFWWAYFADDMSTDSKGWTYIPVVGSLLSLAAGIVSFVLVFAFLRLTLRQSPHWAITAIFGFGAGLVGVPAGTAIVVALGG